MRNIDLFRVSPPVEEKALRILENGLGVDLPNHFREWLILHNGARPGSSNEMIEREQVEGLPCSIYITDFLSLDEILETMKTYDARIPRGYIPVSEDGAGNVICLCILGPKRGAVYFWDHEQEPLASELLEQDAPRVNDNLFFIASSFNEFLDLLGPNK